MPSLEEVSDFVYSYLELPTVSADGTHFHTRCPVCGDSKKNYYKKRFHLQFRSEEHIEWHCFNCDESGDFYGIYSLCTGMSAEDAFKYFNKYETERITKRVNRKRTKTKEVKKEKKDYQNFNYILKDCVAIDEEPDGLIQSQFQKKLKEFAKNRKIKQKIYIAYDGDFRGRVIIPVWYEDNMIYFQGRALRDDVEPKYLNPSVYKSNVILNKEKFKKDKYIIACEGLFDAFSVGNQGTSIIGKELTQEFVNMLLELTDKGIIVVMDNDEDGLKKLKQYISLYPKLKFFIMPPQYSHMKDLNEILININIDDMYKFVVENSFSNSKARMKLMLMDTKR